MHNNQIGCLARRVYFYLQAPVARGFGGTSVHRGIVMIIAIMTIPAAMGNLFSKDMKGTMLLGTFFAVVLSTTEKPSITLFRFGFLIFC